MRYSIQKYNADEWRELGHYAHRLVFQENRDPLIDRISFALLAHNGEEPVGYVTCRELDSESLYWQYGGAMDEFRGFTAVTAFKLFFDHCRENYNRISMLVKNDNIKCLHLLMKMGFVAIGIRFFGGDIFLEMFWKKETK